MSSNMFGDKHNHYSIRKLSVGAASVLIGATIYLGGVNAQAVRADSVNEDATEQVEKKDEANVKAAEVKTTEQKQENNKTAVSATNENAKQNVAENTSDSKKVASNRDVNVIKNDVTTDEKAAAKSSVQTDKAVNANKLNTNTVSVNKLQRNVNVAGLAESKATSEINSTLSVRESMQQKAVSLKANEIARTVIMNKPAGPDQITQSVKLGTMLGSSNGQIIDGKTTKIYTATVIAVGSSTDMKKYRVTVDSDTGEILAGQDLYDTFMNLQPSDFKVNLDAIDQSQIDVPGYTWKITSATPAGANIGKEDYTFGNPQTITIDYTRDVEGNIKKKVTEITDKLVNNQMTTEPARTVILKKTTTGAANDETIVQKADIRGLARTSSKTVAGITEKKIEVAIAPYVEPDKPSSQYYKQYTITFNPDTGQIISGQNDYDQLMALKRSDFKADLPAIEDSQIDVPGYTAIITSATPAGAGLEAETYTFGHPQTITIDYTKVKHTVTYQFKDPFGNQVGTSVPVTGAVGSNQSVNLTLPDGYQLASGSLPTSVTIPESDKIIPIPVKHQLTITLSGESVFNYADDNWQNLVETNELPASGYYVEFNDANARVQLNDGDVTYNENRNAGTYTVSLTEKGLNDIKDQSHDNFIYPDLKDVKSEAKFIINKGNKTISLMGGDTKVFDNTSTLPDQGTFYSGLGLADNDQGRISVYNSDGNPRTIQLTPADVEFWFNGHKIAKDQAKNVGNYNLRLTDDFINKVKAADGNNGNNYEWAYGTNTPTGSDTYTADYVIYQATGKAKLSGNNSKLYDGNAVTTDDVNKGRKITIDLTLPVYKQADEPGDEPQLLGTVDLGKYTLQDGDYTWANGTAPTKGGSYTINLNKDKILAHLQDRLVALAGKGTDPDDSTKSLSNVTISADDMAGQATFAIETTTTYQFVDDDDNGSKVGTPVSKTGLKGESSNISLTVPTNYVLAAGQTLPTSVTFGDTNTTVDIHLKHATKTVDKNNVPDGYTKDDFAETINRTITAKEPTGDVDLSQTTELTRTGTYDEVTKKVISYGNWTTGNFDEVTAPEVAGYTPSQANVAAVTGVTPDYVDPKVVITYAPNDQTGKISYVDVNTGTEVGNTPLTGKTDEEVTINPVAPTGWKIVDGQSIPRTEKATPTGIPPVTVKVEHKTTVVPPTDPKTPKDKLPDNPDKHYPDGVGEKDLNKIIVRQITVVKPDGTREKHDQSVKLTRNATVDEVTGEVIKYGDWTTSNFGEYDAPTVPGYTPSQAKVEGVKVTADSDFTPVEITYTPNAQKTTVTYVDENDKEITNPDGSVIPGSHYDVTGVTNKKVDTNIQKNVPTNWHITDPEVPATITFGADGHTPITVHVAHNTKPVDKNDLPDNYKESDFSKTINRTITAKEPNKDVDLSQEIELTRTGTYDEVTKKVISYSDWTTGKFDEVKAPEVAGYTPSQAKVDGVDKVTVDYVDPNVVITYIEDPVGQDITVKKGDTPDPEDGVKNHGDLDKITDPKHPGTKTTYTWKKTPDTSVAGDVPATVVVHYPDGSDKPVDITVHVVDDTPVVPTKNPDPVGQDITVKKGDTPDPEDGVKNHGDLDKITDPKHPGTKTTYTWKKTQDTSVAGDVPATVVVHYPDGSDKSVDIRVHVVDDTPVVPTKNPDPVGQDITVKKGDTPDPEDGVNNHGDLDKITDPKHPGTKTTYTWKKTPDTSVAGDVPATVVVHYPDGSDKSVDITVHVVDDTPVVPTKNPDPTGQDIHTPQGKVPTPESAITNKDKMPDGTKYTWKEIPDVNTLGKHPNVVVVTYPDGTAVEVKVNVFVDGTPEVKKETKAPVVKKQVVEPTKVETRQKLVNNYVAPRAVEVQRAQAKGKRQLPQTGAKENIASEVLGMLSVGLGALTAGFASKRRKKNR
ncbi:Rib/alpha-like domain-containing protein [Lactobacillus gasseri]|uniref:Rib/alpha-like domain-containing protein n=1 Tax=Lactobacillus gasseri TaxID=1596 RepID=UPI003FA54A9B